MALSRRPDQRSEAARQRRTPTFPAAILWLAMKETSPSLAYSLFATCPRNTEGLVLQELNSLGAAHAHETGGGVAFQGSLELAYRVCLWSRVASRVYLQLSAFPAASVADIYENVRLVDWRDHLSATGTLAASVTSAVRAGPLAAVNTHYAAQVLKDAVVDQLRDTAGARPSVALVRPDLRIHLHLGPETAALYLDLSGESLHRRGYRTEGGAAPLKENLAAAVLLRAGWPQIAAAGGFLADPMCGSGTLLIEGAMLAGDIAPGLLRTYFGFLRWLGHDAGLWARLVEDARQRRHEGLPSIPPVFGSDADQQAIDAARANATRAGLASHIVFARSELTSLTSASVLIYPSARRPLSELPSQTPGLVVTNPPYGHRLGTTAETRRLYETLGNTLKRVFPDCNAAVLTAEPELAFSLGLRAHRTHTLYNGPLRCTLLSFRIFSPAASGAVSRTTDAPSGDQGPRRRAAASSPFANRLHKNWKHLRRWAAREEVTCYRVYDADIPEYNVAVDLYEDWAHVQEYAAPPTVDPAKARQHLAEVLAAVPEVLDLPSSHVVLKTRRKRRRLEQYTKLAEQKHFLAVREGDLRFLVNLTDYLDTGLFLDHRPTRRLIRELARGGRFLNLFAYTGSATVYAAAGGAASTTSVDLSSTYLEWAKRNLELNDLLGPQHTFVRADCREWLTQCARTGKRGRLGEYDLVFLDAPTFSNSARMAGHLDIQRDHAELIRAAARLLSPHGVLLFSTNYRRFRLDPTISQEYETVDMTTVTIPLDFARNPRIHSCYRITRRTR